MKLQTAIVRITVDTFGNNVGGKVFTELSHYFKVPVLSNNVKIHANAYEAYRFDEVSKVDTLIIVNPSLNFYGGVVRPFTHNVVKLILTAKCVMVYITDPLLRPKVTESTKPINGINDALKLIHSAATINHSNTKFIQFFIARKTTKVITDSTKKRFDMAYYGNKRSGDRQKQVDAYIQQSKSSLVVGYENDLADECTEYTPDFLHTINEAFVTPIIGDKYIHYEHGAPTLRLYEPLFTTTIGLVDEQFVMNGLMGVRDEFITSVKSFANDIERVKQYHKAYCNIQWKQLAELQKQFRTYSDKITNYI